MPSSPDKKKLKELKLEARRSQGARLRLARGKFTQAELASALGRKAATIGEWERGESSPNADDLKLICEFLSVSAEFLVLGPSVLLSVSTAQELVANAGTRALEPSDLATMSVFVDETARSSSPEEINEIVSRLVVPRTRSNEDRRNGD